MVELRRRISHAEGPAEGQEEEMQGLSRAVRRRPVRRVLSALRPARRLLPALLESEKEMVAMTQSRVQREYNRRVKEADWVAEATRRFGPQPHHWRFICPSCGLESRGLDYKSAKAPVGALGFSCIGNWLPNKSKAFSGMPGPCDYRGDGPFRVNPVTVIQEDGTEITMFEFGGDPASILLPSSSDELPALGPPIPIGVGGEIGGVPPGLVIGDMVRLGTVPIEQLGQVELKAGESFVVSMELPPEVVAKIEAAKAELMGRMEQEKERMNKFLRRRSEEILVEEGHIPREDHEGLNDEDFLAYMAERIESDEEFAGQVDKAVEVAGQEWNQALLKKVAEESAQADLEAKRRAELN